MSESRPSTPNDVLTIERAEQLKALGHPLRLRVLEMLGGEGDEPLTNRELAQTGSGSTPATCTST